MRQQLDSTWEARGGRGDLRGQAQTRQVSRTGTVRPATKTVARRAPRRTLGGHSSAHCTARKPLISSSLDSKPRFSRLRKHACRSRRQRQPALGALFQEADRRRRVTPRMTPRPVPPAPTFPVQPEHSPSLRTQHGAREASCCSSLRAQPASRHARTQWTRESKLEGPA